MHPRHISPLLADALSDTPVVVIHGARQSGKNTLVQSLTGPEATPRRYLTLDDSAVLNAAKSDPAGFISGLQGPVTLDEVQRAPELFLPIKAAVDIDRQPGRCLVFRRLVGVERAALQQARTHRAFAGRWIP